MRTPAGRWRQSLGQFAFALGIASLAVTVIAAVAQSRDYSVFLLLLSMVLAGVGFLSALIARRVVLLALCVSAWIITAIVVPGVMRACCQGSEASAIGVLRAINSAQYTYKESCAHGGYAIDLADLARAPSTGSVAFISSDLNVNGIIRNGYIFSLVKDAAAGVTDAGAPADTCNGSVRPPATSYFASANPKEVGVTAGRFFATDKSGTIVFSTKGPIPNPIQLGPDVQPLQ